MRRELFILRHAKSSWSEVDKSDKDRALKPKGIKDITNLAKETRETTQNIDTIICSPANRAIHTAVLFAEEAGIPLSAISINEKLYEADETVLNQIIADIPSTTQSVMIVGHNPTLSYYVNSILPEPIFELPTSGFVCLYFDAPSWDDIGKSTLKDFNTSYILSE